MRDLALLAAVKTRVLYNTVRTFREHSKLKLAVVSVFGVSFWAGLFLFFYGGFRFIHRHVDEPVFNRLIDDNLLALYFFSLFLMLSFSTGLILQASLFKARETEFLLVGPLSESSLFACKFAESLGFSTWVVLFLGTPVVLAYGGSVGAPGAFYALVPLALVLFLLIPAALGSLVVLAIAGYLVRHRRAVAWTLIAAVGLGLAWVGYQIAGVGEEQATPFTSLWVLGVFDKIAFCQHPMMPTYWTKEVVVRLATGRTHLVAFYTLLLAANALFLFSLGERLAHRRLRIAYSEVAGSGQVRRRRTEGGLTRRAIDLAFWFLPERTKLYLDKDVKSFLRDPVQRYQFLILIGLLFLYIVNLRTLQYDDKSAFWRNLIAFLNLGATSLTMTTFASRFVFPLLSLEGKRFWILGVLPIERRAILTGKFVYALSTTLLISETLILLSCYMLRVPLGLAIFHAFTVAGICLGVSGLSVGLGALYPNFRVDDPSKIVSGFGGTLNLVLSLAFILTVILVEAIPCHHVLVQADEAGGFRASLALALVPPAAIGLLICLLASWLPMRLGARHFERLEF